MYKSSLNYFINHNKGTQLHLLVLGVFCFISIGSYYIY